MIVNIDTPVEGCEKKCSKFDVECINLYADGEIYYRAFQCVHFKQCQAMYEYIEQEAKKQYGRAE